MCQVENEQQKPKRKTYTSSAVKNRWNSAHYKVIKTQVKPDLYDRVTAYRTAHGLSVSQFLEKAINELEKKEKD